MTTIPLPTSEETRAKLKAAGFAPAILDLRFEYWDKNGHRYHLRREGDATVYQLRNTLDDLPLNDALEFASLVGLPIPGYRLIPEDVAERARGLCLLRANECAKGGYPEWRSDSEAWQKTATALSGEIPKEEPLSTEGDQG